MNCYKSLNKQVFEIENYKIVPIRFEDRTNIMNWRNEQMYHLRQSKLLTIKDQDNYFNNIIKSEFGKENPNQILFSYLKDDICIGYGGLVHINWIDNSSEISFLMNTELENEYFELHWTRFLHLIEDVAFQELNFYKIFTYAFDLRPNLYKILKKSSFENEAILKDHCLFEEKYIDVYIHSKKNKNFLYFRKARVDDIKIYYKWINNPEVRIQSYNSSLVDFENHKNWFESKIKDELYFMLIFQNLDKQKIGQVRIQKIGDKESLIGISVDENHRGNNHASRMLNIASKYFLSLNSDFIINAFIKVKNLGSEKAFKKAGFEFKQTVVHENSNSFHLIKKINENWSI